MILPFAEATVAATPIRDPKAAKNSSQRPWGSAGPNFRAVAATVTTVIPSRMKTEKYLLNLLLSTAQI